MRKLSKAQEKILRQIANGDVKLVYVGGNDHSIRVWNAVDKDNKNVNRQYDVLRRLDLITAPYVPAGQTRRVFLTTLGEQLISGLGFPGRLIAQDFAPGAAVDSWMLRKESGDRDMLPFILYKNGLVYDRYSRLESAWIVFRSHCPLQGTDLEASLSR